MSGLSFRVWKVPRRDLLAVLGVLHGQLADAVWHFAPDAEIAGEVEAARRVEAWSDSGKVVSTSDLMDVARLGVQLLDAELRAMSKDGKPVLVLRAVRGDEWDVETTSQKVLNVVRTAFPDARPIPGP
jgi:hypothetical protein